MKRISSILMTLVLFLSMASCRETERNSQLPVNPEEFKEIGAGERVFADHEFVFPQSLLITSDRLLVGEPHEEKGLYVGLPLSETDSLTYLGSRGMGPCELLSTRNEKYNFQDSTLYIYDPNMRVARIFSMEKGHERLTEKNLLREINLRRSEAHETQPYYRGIVTNWVSGTKMFALLDSAGTNMVRFGEYPGDKTGIEDSTRFSMAHQVLLTVDDTGKHFVAAGRFSDWITFYDLSGDEPKLQNEYFTYESPVEVNKSEIGKNVTVSMKSLPETVTAYTDLIPTPEHVYGIYRGISDGEISEGKRGPTYIHKFSWDGKFEGGYKLTGDPVGAVAITPDGKEMYAVTRGEGEDIIIKRYTL